MAVWSIVKVSELEGAKRLDAEYYRPIYKTWAEQIQKIGYEEIGGIGTVSYGTTPPGGVFEEEGIPFVRSQAFSLLSVDSTALVYCSYDFHKENVKSEIRSGDILLAAVGATVGELAIVPNDIPSGNINQNIARVKIWSRDFLPSYVAVFLATRLGQFQIHRLATGNAQPYLNSAQIRLLRIPKVPLPKQKIFEEILERVRDKLQQSDSFYLQAEQIVLEEVGWHTLDLSQPRWWTVPLSQAREVHRLDAEHFQPRYDKLIVDLNTTGKAKRLGEIPPYIKHGLQPEYVQDDEVLVFTEKHLGRYLLNVDAAERTSLEFWKANPKARVQKGDVIMYSIGAYIGRANIYMESRNAITSSNATIIRPNPEKVVPEYLAVYLNSHFGMLQAQKWTASVGQMALYPGDIPKFWVYLPSEKFQQKVADLVQQSYQARQKAKSLLEEAKAKVEALIEGVNNKVNFP